MSDTKPSRLFCAVRATRLRHRERACRPAAARAEARTSLGSTSGETITEVLVGVLIVGLATVLFATMVGVAVNISATGTDRTTATYRQLSDVDAGTAATPATGTVTLKAGTTLNTSFTVDTLTSTVDAHVFTRYALPTLDTAEGGD